VYSANGTDDVITFCVKSPDGAMTKDDLNALDFLEIVKKTQQNWVIPGTALPDSTPHLNHNVSNTITVKSDEWDDVANFIWENREYFTGVSLIPDDDNIYQQAPHQQILSDDDELRWTNYLETYEKIDYTTLNEEEDQTVHKDIVACAGGACELK
jgi:ribonucleoside-diphosphate reductase alpha chain